MNKNKNKKIVVLVENGMLVAVRANFQDNIDVEEFEIGSGQDEATRENFKVPKTCLWGIFGQSRWIRNIQPC